MKKKIFIFDIDNTICTTRKRNYNKSKPLKSIISKINSLKDNGHYIKMFTARYMGRSNGNTKEAYERGYEQAKNQLKLWGVRHHKLVLGKPEYDIIIDDKGYGYNTNWIQEL